MKRLTFKYNLEDCPSSGELVDFRRRKLPKKQDSDIAHHLTFCKTCSAKVTILDPHTAEASPEPLESSPELLQAMKTAAEQAWIEKRWPGLEVKPGPRQEVVSELADRVLARLLATMHGNIENIGVPAVIRLVANLGKAGRLLLRKAGTACLIFFEDGVVYDAELTGDVNGDEAIRTVLDWREGEYALDLGVTSPRRSVSTQVAESLRGSADAVGKPPRKV